MKFQEVIDLLMEKQGFTNLDQAADYVGLSRGGLLHIKAGRGGLKDAVIEKLMEGTGLEAFQIEAAWKAQFARTEKVRRSWERWSEVATFAAVAALPALTAAVTAGQYILC